MSAKLIALLLAALAFAGLGLWGQQQHLAAVKAKAEVTTLKANVTTLQRANKSLADDAANKDTTNLALRKELDRSKTETAVAQKELNDALKANPDWAATRLPDRVRDALRPRSAPGAKARPGVDRAGGSAGAARR